MRFGRGGELTNGGNKVSGYYRWEDWEFDEERDLPRHKVWITDRKETLRSPTFMDIWGCINVYGDAFSCGAEYLQTPNSRGADYRLKNGWMVVSVNETTEEERRQRELEFRKRIAPWIEDFGKEYHKFIDVLNKEAEKIKAVDVEKATDWELKRAFEDWLEYYNRAAQIHFIWLYAYCDIYRLFEDACEDLLGIGRYDRLFNDLMGGFDQKMLQTDRGQWQLAKLARELGLEPIFQSTTDNRKLLQKLGEEGERGRKWLGELRKFVDEYGWRTVTNWDFGNPSWVEDPSRALPGIRAFMAQPTFVVDNARKLLVSAREKAEKAALSRVPEEHKDWFAKLMRAAQWSSIADEEHVFYAENYGNALGRYVTKEIGKRFAKWGLVDDPTDVYYLLPQEIDIRIIPKFDASDIVKIRRKQHEEFRNTNIPDFFGDPSAIPETMMADSAISSTAVPVPRVRSELKGDLYGTVAAPGYATGIAHVIMSESKFADFKPGEILVTVETSAAWTPLFAIAKAVITDVGGYLSHCAIAAREYGVPAVSGTMEGTKKIKTGMRLKVDGDSAVVYILEK